MSRAALRNHGMWHKGERRFVCDGCGKAFCTSNHLKRHKKTAHSEGEIVKGGGEGAEGRGGREGGKGRGGRSACRSVLVDEDDDGDNNNDGNDDEDNENDDQDDDHNDNDDLDDGDTDDHVDNDNDDVDSNDNIVRDSIARLMRDSHEVGEEQFLEEMVVDDS